MLKYLCQPVISLARSGSAEVKDFIVEDLHLFESTFKCQLSGFKVTGGGMV